MKQVIVMRTDLNMRKGKMVAQGAHAAMLFLHVARKAIHTKPLAKTIEKFNALRRQGAINEEWFDSGMKKICVGCDSEDALMDLHKTATEAKLLAYYVTDAGHTEFHGQPTVTCLAIGPGLDEDIDNITRHLKLL